MTDRLADLTELANAYGVATEYWDWEGRHVNVAEETLRAILSALEVPCGSDEEIAAALERKRTAPWRRALPPVLVVRHGYAVRVPVHLPHGAGVSGRIRLESGRVEPMNLVEHNVDPREIDGVLTGEAMLESSPHLPQGYHTVEVELPGGWQTCSVAIVPNRLEVGEALTGTDSKRWGLMTQLYQIRSQRSWGIGDTADLADLGAWGAEVGADFVLINPVHAAEVLPPMEPSPYLPTSRRFMNPIYIRIEDIPEVGYLSSAERQLVEWAADDAHRLNQSETIDRDGAWERKLGALRLLYKQPRSYLRQRDFELFVKSEGQGLLDYATWAALCVRFGPTWQEWPEEYHDVRSAAVAGICGEMRSEVDFHCWMQWIVQGQMADTQRELREAGMRIGVVHDLAVGVHPSGADAWALKDVLARGVSVGAPPDQYTQVGQDWSQPPWRPDLLEETAYAPYRAMVRTALQAAGGLRVDHILGLFRLWWVPAGASPKDGAYVRYDHEALIGILCLEAQRSGAVVIGEDLGTVEPWVRDYLRERGVFGTSILWFERDQHGQPLPPEAYRELCLSTVTTHDLPPTAGYLLGEHITVRDELGLLTRPVAEERAEDAAAQEDYFALLRAKGLLREGATLAEKVEALHRFLTLTPSKMRGVAVADLVGDRRGVNQPGTYREYPNWCVPLSGPDGSLVMLEDIVASKDAICLTRAVAGE